MGLQAGVLSRKGWWRGPKICLLCINACCASMQFKLCVCMCVNHTHTGPLMTCPPLLGPLVTGHQRKWATSCSQGSRKAWKASSWSVASPRGQASSVVGSAHCFLLSTVMPTFVCTQEGKKGVFDSRDLEC